MTRETARKIKCIVRAGEPENDFNDPYSWYYRIDVRDNNGKREFLIKGLAEKFKIVEVGLGEHKIGFRTVMENITTLDLNDAIQNVLYGY